MGFGFALWAAAHSGWSGFATLIGEGHPTKALHFNPGTPYQGMLARRPPPRRLALEVHFKFNCVGRDAGMRRPRAYFQRVVALKMVSGSSLKASGQDLVENGQF